MLRSDRRIESADSSRGDSEERAPVDLQHLRRYTLGDQKLEREVLELFCAHAPAMMAKIKAAGCEKSWRNAAHTLKGSALAIGAWDVARHAAQAEAAAARFGETGDIVARLESAVEQARHFIAMRHPEA